MNEHLYFVKNREISTAVVENVTSRWTSRIDVNFFLSATSDPGKVQHFLNVARMQVCTWLSLKLPLRPIELPEPASEPALVMLVCMCACAL